MPLLFVYGTLRRGGSAHGLLAGQRWAGPARTRPAFRLHGMGGFPALVPAASGARAVEGELWWVQPARLERIDRWEGVPDGVYARRPVALLPPHQGLPAQAYVYLRGVAGRADLGSSFREPGAGVT